MSNYLEIQNVSLDIPVFDLSRSFRQSLVKCCIGGQITKRNNNNHKISVRALEDISFRLESGDRLGLIGYNGSGKTTLLRVLSGVYTPSIGHVYCKGKVTSLFNPCIGLDMDDTGLENIFTIGMYLGMKKQEIVRKQDDIILSSGLGDFINFPVKTYSTGMLLRLSFAMATSLEPEILLMDEAIGTGDMQFTEMAQTRLESFYKQINILVMASHSDALIRRLCNKALLLEKGKIKAYGEVEKVLRVYYEK